ncbi:MAG TPA: outer membrane beta-barrel protein [Flavobacterium sp.]|nr:outer membrane beta-barrel protein [Flavobacterium sp.]
MKNIKGFAIALLFIAFFSNCSSDDDAGLPPQAPKTWQNAKDSVPPIIDPFQRLNIFVYAGPTFSGYISKKSPLDKKLNFNQTSSETEITYGALVSYGATERWSLRFGLGIANLRFVTKSADVNTTNYYNISYTKNISNHDIYTQADSPERMDIIQDISYTEIPLELKYIVSKRKIGFNAFGGLSYMFLNANSVSVKTENGRRFDIGETANLASNTFTINLGVGLDYKLPKGSSLM